MTDRSRGIALTRGRFLRLTGAAGLSLAAPALGRPAGAAAEERALRTRTIPGHDEALPVVGVGTWQTFDVPADSPRMADLEDVLRRLFAAGGSVIDSSPMYGEAEARVGELLERLDARDRAFLATKVWTRGREAGIAQMEESIRRMHAARMDLMQVHNLLDLDTHLETLRAWKAEGGIRYLGVTHYTTAALDRLAGIIEREHPDFVQLAYSVTVPDAERRVLPLARERGVGIIVNRPFDGGGLFRRLAGRELPDWARDFCESWAQFMLKYILAEPAVTCVIPGTSNPDHMSDNLAAGMGRLPEEDERARMRAFVADL